MLLFIPIAYEAKAIKITSRSFYVDDIHNLTRIDNISALSISGDELPDDWFRIGNEYWYCDTTTHEYQKNLGRLICTFSHEISDINNNNYGERAILKVYNIEKELRLSDSKMNRDFFYHQLCNKLINDSASIWKTCTDFEPMLALTTWPGFHISETGEDLGYMACFLIFANDRIYSFDFENNKSKNETKGLDPFDNRCISLIKGMDLGKFQREEAKENNEKILNEHRKRNNRLLYSIPLLICGLFIPFFFIGKIGSKNQPARKLTFYTLICFFVAVIAMAIGAMSEPNNEVTLYVFLLIFCPSCIIYILTLSFLKKKSYEIYHEFYLIPEKLINIFKIDTVYRKRLALLFIVFPFFYIVPVPVVGLCIFVYYILPLVFLMFIFVGAKRIITWLKEGKKMDNNHRYCENCGKQVDLNSRYCRFCGNKL